MKHAKKINKHRGVMSIEAALIFPFIFIFVLLIIDISYISFAKNNTISKIEFTVLKSKTDLPEHTNTDFNSAKESAKDINQMVDEKLSRTIFDELAMNISEEGFSKRLNPEIKQSLPGGLKRIRKAETSIERKLFKTNYIIEYKFNFNTLLSGLYKDFGIKINKLKGTRSFSEDRIFNEIVSVDLVEKFLSKHTSLEKHIYKLNKGLDGLNAKLK